MGSFDGVLLKILYSILPAIFIIGSHEYIKALASVKMGDNLPKAQKRLTMNPLAHIDIIGLIFMVWWGYGFANPVQTSPMFYKNKRKDTLIVYILPSLFTFVLGIMFLYIFVLLEQFILNESLSWILIHLSNIFYMGAYLAIKYALFNIVPVYPLDGAKILSLFLKPQTVVKMTQYEKVLQIALIACIIFGVFDKIFNPIVRLILGALSM